MKLFFYPLIRFLTVLQPLMSDDHQFKNYIPTAAEWAENGTARAYLCCLAWWIWFITVTGIVAVGLFR